MTSTKPEQPGLEGTDVSKDQSEQDRDREEMSALMSVLSLDKASKELQYKADKTVNNIIQGQSNSADNVRVRDTNNERRAVKKRRRGSYQRNKHVARLRAAIGPAPSKVFEPTAAERKENEDEIENYIARFKAYLGPKPPKVLEPTATEKQEQKEKLKQAKEEASRFFDHGRLKCNPDLFIDQENHLRSQSENADNQKVALSRLGFNPKYIHKWDELGANSWDGYEEDDVEGEPTVTDTDRPALGIHRSPGKGHGLFALSDIKKGAQIFREAAIFERKLDAHSWLHVEAWFEVLPKPGRAQVLSLAKACDCKETPCVETTLEKIWVANSFRKVSGEKAGEFLFYLASHVNHDCRPSSYFTFTKDGHIVFYASRGIRKGEEITYNYRNIPGPADLRRMILKHRYGFTCQCSACVDDIVLPFTHASSAFSSYENIEVKGYGSIIIPVPLSPEENQRLAEALSWADSCQAKLDKEREWQLHFFAQCAVRIPLSSQQIVSWSQMFTRVLKREILEENHIYVDEDGVNQALDEDVLE